MTKNGDRYLRTLMIHGARAVITRGLKNRPELAQWVQPIIDRRVFKSRETAKTAIFEFIEVFYNRQRVHQTLDYKTPMQVEKEYRLVA